MRSRYASSPAAAAPRVLGIDVTALSNSQWSEVAACLGEHGVIFFRDQKLTPEQHLALRGAGRRSTSTVSSRRSRGIRRSPRYARSPSRKPTSGGGWHTDHSYDPAPAMGSILLARELPEGRRRYAVRQHVPRLRDAFARPAADARGSARRARFGAHLRQAWHAQGQPRIGGALRQPASRRRRRGASRG